MLYLFSIDIRSKTIGPAESSSRDLLLSPDFQPAFQSLRRTAYLQDPLHCQPTYQLNPQRYSERAFRSTIFVPRASQALEDRLELAPADT